jgi:phage repressor protein C with HTH and peptisase S24 domain
MDKIRELVRARLSALNLSMAEVSKAMGKNHAYLQQFLERNSPQSLPEEVRAKLATILGVSEAVLRGAPAAVSAPPNLPLSAMMRPNDVWQGSDHIPVVGTAEGGPDGLLEWNGDVIDRISRPPSLAGAKDAYALFVNGTSMEPRYFQGELIYVHPGRPVTPGSFVVVQIYRESATPAAWVKQFIRRDQKQIVLRQFNPAKDLKLPVAEVRSIHKIVASGES